MNNTWGYTKQMCIKYGLNLFYSLPHSTWKTDKSDIITSRDTKLTEMSNAPLLPPIFQLYFTFVLESPETTQQTKVNNTESKKKSIESDFWSKNFCGGMKLKNQENRRNENVEWILLAMSSIILYLGDCVCGWERAWVWVCVSMCQNRGFDNLSLIRHNHTYP